MSFNGKQSCFIAALGIAAPCVAAADLVAHWTLDGPAPAVDASGQGHTAIALGDP